MKNYLKLGFAIFTFFGTNALAEGNCPQGMYPIGGGNAGWQGCAPIPGGGGSGGGQSYNGGGGRWLDSYGALVLGNSKIDGSLKYSYSFKFDTEKQANDRAMLECQKNDFVNCRNETSFWNGYFVVAGGEDGQIYWGIDKKEGKAKKLALEACKKRNNKACKALKTIDSRPDWVQ